jgi:hypothetical protein
MILISKFFRRSCNTMRKNNDTSYTTMTSFIMDLCVITNSCKGGFPFRIRARIVKNEEIRLKNPSNEFIQGRSHECQAQHTKKSISGLKIKRASQDYSQRRGSIDGADRQSSGMLEPKSCTRISTWAHPL